MINEIKNLITACNALYSVEYEGCSYCGKSVIEAGFINKKTQKKYLSKGLCNNCYKRKYKYGRLEQIQLTPNKYPKKLISTFENMKRRCYNESTINYKNYGGKGIAISDEWLNNLGEFHKWSLENGYDDSLTIDRIDTNGNYEPKNCRWVNQHYQQSNRCNNNKIVGVAKFRNKWQSYIDYGGKHYCKKFDNFDDAVNWRKQKEVEFNIYK